MNMIAWLPSLQIAFSPERVTRLNEVPVTTDDSGVSTQSSASENRGVSGGAGGVGVTMGGGVCSGLPPPPQAERDKAITMITERMAEKFLRYQKWIGLYTELFRKSVDLGD
tara:strand:+ start:120 stop:452 length:333 start_codon:yes stop_codon:yes gene_type:complete